MQSTTSLVVVQCMQDAYQCIHNALVAQVAGVEVVVHVEVIPHYIL